MYEDNTPVVMNGRRYCNSKCAERDHAYHERKKTEAKEDE